MKNKRKAIISTVAVTSAVSLCLTLTGCVTQSEKIIQYLEEKKYDEALKSVSKRDLSREDRKELVSAMREELENVVDAFANGETDYDTVSNIISTIYQMNFTELDGDIGAASARFQQLQDSKNAYEQAKKALEAGQYVDAINSFNQVVQDDCNYEDAASKIAEAKEKYAAQVMDEAKAKAKKGEYSDAIKLLSDAEGILSDSEEIKALLTEYKRDFAMQKADEYIKKNDYEQAIKEIEDYRRSSKDDSSEIASYTEKIENEYVSLILEKVEKLRTEKDYLTALTMLENASKVVSSTKFDDMIETLNKERPVYLSELKYQSADRFEEIGAGEERTDTIGNKYTTGNLFEMSSNITGWESSKNAHADYYLGYKYQTLRGTIAVDDLSDDYGCSIIIEGDGVVLYSLDLTRLTVPTAIEIDISNVNYLTIRSGDTTGGTFYILMSNFSFET